MKNSMKLLVICPTLSDNGLAASFRLIHILNYLLSKEVDISVFVSDSDISKVLKNDQHREHLDIHIVKNKSNYLYKIINRLFGIPDSVVFWGNKVKKEIFKEYKSSDFDAIFTSSPPHSLQVIGMQIAKHFNIPLFTDFRDDWMGSHRLKHITLLHRYLSSKKENDVFENSTLITQAIPFVAKEWQRKFPLYAEKIYPLSNGYPPDVLTYKENYRTKNYPKNTIVYFGGDYNGFVVDMFTQLRQELIKENLSDRWMIITGGPFDIPFENDDTWVHYGNISQDQVYDYIYNGTVHISLLPPGDLLPSRTIPLKLYTQLTTRGACIFIGNKGATTELFKDIEGVYFFGKDGWAKLGIWLKENEIKIVKQDYTRENINRFNYENIAKELLELMYVKLGSSIHERN